MHCGVRVAALLVSAAAFGMSACSAEGQNAPLLRVEPARISLPTARSEARIIATLVHPDGRLEDVTRRVRLVSLPPAVVQPDSEGVLRPTRQGKGTLKVAFGKLAAYASVEVNELQRERPVEFSREVLPVLTRAGCNQGACHGSQHGKGGFKLSLFGLDPELDYQAIVRQARARRVLPADPEQSLLLRKPALLIAHKGGKRLESGSPGYELLRLWISQGAPPPSPKDPEVSAIEVHPARRIVPQGTTQPLVVRALFTDGQTRDVTRWARLSSLNEGVARVDDKGAVSAVGKGETAIMVRYGGQATVARITAPYNRIARYPSLPEHNYIDRLVNAKWKELGLLPSRMCDDSTFLRRAMLDLIGTLPTADEARAFLTDRSADKRAKLIDRLLDRPEYADYWSLKWGDLLRSNRTLLGGAQKPMWSLTNWIRAQFRDNVPMDQFARTLLLAQGSTFTTGPANFYRVAGNPPDRAETTAQVFLGMRLQCAKCHHHPYERWSQADYYRFAAFFARIGLKGSQEFGIFGGDQVLRVNPGGEVHHPKTGALMKPAPLGGYPETMRVRNAKTAALEDPDPDAGGDRRALLAEWMTRGNRQFARNIVNRYWGYLMGRGLVEPIDDQRVTNPPTNPELLDALADDFVKHGYDVKHLLRTICGSRVYQLSADVTKENAADTAFYTHYLMKRLPAEVMLDAVNAATGTLEKFDGLPLGVRAIQLPDPQFPHYFLDTFGRAPRVTACECERPAEPNMGQALHLMMGDVVNRKVQDGNGLVSRLLAAKLRDSEIIETLYLTALSRYPTAAEMAGARMAVHAAMNRPASLPAEPVRFIPVQIQAPRTMEAQEKDRKAVLEDILWTLINSKEFAFNH